jgi:mycothiol synthase
VSDMRLSPALPHGVVARGATLDDVGAAVAVTRAAERVDNGGSLTTPEDLRRDWSRPSVDLATDVVLVEEAGRVVAYGEEYRGRAFAHVHPDVRGRGIGTWVAAWTERHARVAGMANVGQTLSTLATDARRLLEGRGYAPRWDAWILTMPLDAPPPAPRPPAGVTIRALRRPDDDRALYDVIEEAFATWPDRDPPMDFADWRAAMLDAATEPDLVFVAEEDARMVGAALCMPPDDGEGWVDQLAVRPDAWGRGIGGALLQAAFQRFHEQGLATAALTTDSRTGALGVYEHVGMTVTESFVRLSLALR